MVMHPGGSGGQTMQARPIRIDRLTVSGIRRPANPRMRVAATFPAVIALVLAGCGTGANPSPTAESQASPGQASPSTATSSATTSETLQGGPLKVWLGGILASAAPGTPARQWWDEMTEQFEGKGCGP